MDAYFVEMLRRLRLTKDQKEDAVKKYNGVASILHNEFYDTTYDGRTKLLIGSYGKKTNIRPPGDIDLLFKMPLDEYERYVNYSGNGASALLQKIRSVIGAKYTTSEEPRAWGKVVLIKFKQGSHDVELLPAFEVGDGIYQIPNTEDGGSFESFDVGADLAVVSDSSKLTDGLNRKLIKVIKRWRSLHSDLKIKSYQIEELVARFLKNEDYEGSSWSKLVYDFFLWMGSQNEAKEDASYINTAILRALKARKFEMGEEVQAARDEWFKVFGSAFPAYSKAKDIIYTLSRQYPAKTEEFIEDMFPVKIDPDVTVSIGAQVTKEKFRKHPLDQFLRSFGNRLPKKAKLHFTARTNVEGDVEYYWKTRNFGVEAQSAKDERGLRGEIKDKGMSMTEDTLYENNNHYVEVYVIKNGVCVAKATRFIPIGSEE